MPSAPDSGNPHIAFMTDATRVAGSEVWLVETLPRLKAHGLEPSVHLPGARERDGCAARFAEGGVRAARFGDWEDLAQQTQGAALRVLQAGNAHTYTALLPRLNRPRLVLSHDQMQFYYPYGLERLYRTIFAQTKAKAWREADGVLTVSSWSAEFLRGLGLLKAQGLFNGVDSEKFRPASPEELAALRQKLGFAGFTVLYPARLSPEKNHWALLRTAWLTPAYRYILVGEGELSGILRRLAPANVEFWGRRSDMPELYRAADALLQPTLAENQSLATLEAMASGLAIVTSRIPAQLELVSHLVTGLAVEPSPARLAEALKRLEADLALRQGLGKAARQHVLDKHTLRASSLGLAQALKSHLRGQ